MTRCLAPDCQMGGLGCDNMTVVLVCFLHPNDNAPGDYAELCRRCSQSLTCNGDPAADVAAPAEPSPAEHPEPDAVQVIVSL